MRNARRGQLLASLPPCAQSDLQLRGRRHAHRRDDRGVPGPPVLVRGQGIPRPARRRHPVRDLFREPGGRHVRRLDCDLGRRDPRLRLGAHSRLVRRGVVVVFVAILFRIPAFFFAEASADRDSGRGKGGCLQWLLYVNVLEHPITSRGRCFQNSVAPPSHNLVTTLEQQLFSPATSLMPRPILARAWTISRLMTRCRPKRIEPRAASEVKVLYADTVFGCVWGKMFFFPVPFSGHDGRAGNSNVQR